MSYIGKTPTVGNFQVCDAISVVNNQAAYTMQVGSVNVSPESANHMIVSLNGVIQKPTSSFTVSGSTITFAANLVTNDVINFIQILGNVLDLGVPSDSTVSIAKLSATGTKNSTTFLRGDNTFAAAGSPSIDDNGNATAITIDSSENVGIGTGSPVAPLVVSNGGASGMEFHPEISTNTNRFVNYNRSGSAYNKLKVDALEQQFFISGNEQMRLTTNGVLAANAGIALGVGLNNTASNVLDDYEEGTWTPVINNSGVAQLSMTNNGSYYTKIGRMVYVAAELRYTGSTLSSGATIIGAGLPFTAADGPLGCSGSFIHDPGSGNSNYIAGICGAPAGTNFYFIITPGGRYLDKMYNNYYFQFAFNYRV